MWRYPVGMRIPGRYRVDGETVTLTMNLLLLLLVLALRRNGSGRAAVETDAAATAAATGRRRELLQVRATEQKAGRGSEKRTPLNV